jgi:hypothetical protein
MYPQYNCLNVPTWIIGPALGEGLLIDRSADVLKVWPTRETIQRLPPAQFSPLLDQLAEEKTRNGILCTPSVNPPRKQRLASSCVQLARVAVSFFGVSAKNILSNLRGKENVRFLRSGSLTPALSGQRRETCAPPPPQRLVAPVPWNLTPAYFQGDQ